MGLYRRGAGRVSTGWLPGNSPRPRAGRYSSEFTGDARPYYAYFSFQFSTRIASDTAPNAKGTFSRLSVAIVQGVGIVPFPTDVRFAVLGWLASLLFVTVFARTRSIQATLWVNLLTVVARKITVIARTRRALGVRLLVYHGSSSTVVTARHCLEWLSHYRQFLGNKPSISKFTPQNTVPN